jgi:hypothetical protein
LQKNTCQPLHPADLLRLSLRPAPAFTNEDTLVHILNHTAGVDPLSTLDHRHEK